MAESRKVPQPGDLLTAQDLIEVAPFVDGRFEKSSAAERFTQYNPAFGAKLLDIPAGCAEDVIKSVEAARRSFASGAWRKAPPSVRKAMLSVWANLIQRKGPHLDALDALEMGKPVSISAFNATAGAPLATPDTLLL